MKYLLILFTVFAFGQASNQMVTFTQASTLGFSLNAGKSHVTSNQCMTKSDALAKYSLSAGSMIVFDNNQLVPRSSWVSTITSSILGTTGTGPRGITIDASGNIYTANINANNVSKITPSGVSTILGTTGTTPSGITIDASGNVYTANQSSNNVTKITPSGVSTILGTTGTLPSGITIDASGNIYTANHGSNNVSKITQ
jgi:streptogramin lyase